MKRYLLAAVVGAVTASAFATTVIPPSLDDLVAEADSIFQGTVTAVDAHWVGEGAQRHIVTDVQFAVEEQLKGRVPRNYSVRFFGGTVGDEGMQVSDAPKFKAGDKELLFVQHNGTQFIPLVGIQFGRYRILSEASGKEIVATGDGAPVKTAAALGRESDSAVPGEGFTAADFKAAIRQRLSRTAAP